MAGSIKAMIQVISQKGMPGIVEGTVTSAEPVTITLNDDLKINLSAASLIIPESRKPLRKGETFYLLALNNNKIYYVLDRM